MVRDPEHGDPESSERTVHARYFAPVVNVRRECYGSLPGKPITSVLACSWRARRWLPTTPRALASSMNVLKVLLPLSSIALELSALLLDPPDLLYARIGMIKQCSKRVRPPLPHGGLGPGPRLTVSIH